MDAKETLKAFSKELEDDKKDLAEIDLLIRTASDAGENVADLKQKQRQIKTSLDRWQAAIAKNLK